MTNQGEPAPSTGRPRVRWVRLLCGRLCRYVRYKHQQQRLTMRSLLAVGAVVALLGFLLTNFFLLQRSTDSWAHGWQLGLVGALVLSGGYLAWWARLALASRFHRASYVVIAALALYVLLLAFWAYPTPEGELGGLSQLTAGLLLMAGGSPPGDPIRTSLVVQVAQFGGLVVLFATVVTVVAEMSSSTLARVLARFSSSVILIAGLNDESLPVIRSLARDSGGSTIVLAELDPEHPLVPLVRRFGVRVVRSEISMRPRELAWLKGVARGRRQKVALKRVYLLDRDEQVNAMAAEVVRKALKGLGSGFRHEHLAPTRVIVRIDRYRQARRYVAEQVKTLAQTEGPRVFISALGRTQQTAHALAQHIAEHERPDRLLVVGQSEFASAFEDEWRLQRSMASVLKEAVPSVADSGDSAQATRLRQITALLEGKSSLPDPISEEELPNGVELRQLGGDDQMTCIVIADRLEEAAFAKLEERAETLDGSRIQIFVPTHHSRGLSSSPMLGCLRTFGMSLGGLEPEPGREADAGTFTTDPLVGVPQDAWFRAAKLIADRYGVDTGLNGWEDLYPPDRESNFRALWHRLSFLTAEGFDWVSSPGGEGGLPPEGAVDDFVVKEHESWWAFKTSYGWVGVQGSDVKAECLENALLFHWEELTAEAQNDAWGRTVSNIKAVDEALNVLGFHAVAGQGVGAAERSGESHLASRQRHRETNSCFTETASRSSRIRRDGASERPSTTAL